MKIDFECGKNGGDNCSLHGCQGFKYDYEVFFNDGKHYEFAKLCDGAVQEWKAAGWKLQYVKAGDVKAKEAIKVAGYFCASCKTWAAHSEPNQQDGSFICFSCREYPFYL